VSGIVLTDYCQCKTKTPCRWDRGIEEYVCCNCGQMINPDEHGPDADRECPECGGTGENKWDDGITACDYCDGEGYLWWM